MICYLYSILYNIVFQKQYTFYKKEQPRQKRLEMQPQQLPAQLQMLQKQLSIPTDKVNLIVPQSCQNFIKKYERKPNIDTKSMTYDFRGVLQQIQVYSQYTYDVVSKYHCLDKLELLVRSIIEGQGTLLNFMINIVTQSIKDKSIYQNKLQNMTNRIYQRCQNCSRPLQSAHIISTQNQIGMKFRDVYEYFMQDIQWLNKLSEQASLIFQKRALNIEGITEQQYIQKFQKIYENISFTIEHVTSSLNNITSFQEKFNQIQQYQYMVTKEQKQKLQSQKFNLKRYKIDLSKHFYNKIKNLEQKLNKINRFFIPVYNVQTQTMNQFWQCTPQKLKQLKQQIVKLQIQKKQIQVYTNSIQKQLNQYKNKLKSKQSIYAQLKSQKQKLQERVKQLQMQLQIGNVNNRVRGISDIQNNKQFNQGTQNKIKNLGKKPPNKKKKISQEKQAQNQRQTSNNIKTQQTQHKISQHSQQVQIEKREQRIQYPPASMINKRQSKNTFIMRKQQRDKENGANRAGHSNSYGNTTRKPLLKNVIKQKPIKNKDQDNTQAKSIVGKAEPELYEQQNEQSQQSDQQLKQSHVISQKQLKLQLCQSIYNIQICNTLQEELEQKAGFVMQIFQNIRDPGDMNTQDDLKINHEKTKFPKDGSNHGRETTKTKDRYKYRYISNRYKHVMEQLYKDIVLVNNNGNNSNGVPAQNSQATNLSPEIESNSAGFQLKINQYISYQQFVDTFESLVKKLVGNYRNKNNTQNHTLYTYGSRGHKHNHLHHQQYNSMNVPLNGVPNQNTQSNSNKSQLLNQNSRYVLSARNININEPSFNNNFNKSNGYEKQVSFNDIQIQKMGITRSMSKIKVQNLSKAYRQTPTDPNHLQSLKSLQQPNLNLLQRSKLSSNPKGSSEYYQTLLLKSKANKMNKINTQNNCDEGKKIHEKQPNGNMDSHGNTYHVDGDAINNLKYKINLNKDNRGNNSTNKQLPASLNNSNLASKGPLEQNTIFHLNLGLDTKKPKNSTRKSTTHTNDYLNRNSSLLENLPTILKKRERQESIKLNLEGLGARSELPLLSHFYTKDKDQQIYQLQYIDAQFEQMQMQVVKEEQPQFNELDVKAIYHSIQTALQVNQKSINKNIHSNNSTHQSQLNTTLHSLKHKKTQSNFLSSLGNPNHTQCQLQSQQPLCPMQVHYIKQFFTKLASIHLNNKKAYQKIKQFLIYPYDSAISQMTELKVSNGMGVMTSGGAVNTNTNGGTNALRNALRNVVVLHRTCVPRGQMCRHLKYFITKIGRLDRTKILNQKQINDKKNRIQQNIQELQSSPSKQNQMHRN